MKFLIEISRDVSQVASVEVEAKNEEEAIKLAKEESRAGKLNWETTNISFTEFESMDTTE